MLHRRLAALSAAGTILAWRRRHPSLPFGVTGTVGVEP